MNMLQWIFQSRDGFEGYTTSTFVTGWTQGVEATIETFLMSLVRCTQCGRYGFTVTHFTYPIELWHHPYAKRGLITYSWCKQCTHENEQEGQKALYEQQYDL